MQITNNQYNTMPEQVQENKNNIQQLAKNLKEMFNAKINIEQDATSVLITDITDWKNGTTTGFILDKGGDLFNIIAVDETTIYIKYWATLTSGPQGPRGPQGLRGPEGPTGPQGPKGQDGTGFENITDVNLTVGEPSVTYDTEDGITIVSQGSFVTEGDTYTPTVEQNIPLIAGNGMTMDATEDGKHVDIHLSAETVANIERSLKIPVAVQRETKIVAVDNTNSQELLGLENRLEIVNGNLKIKDIVGNRYDYSNAIDITGSSLTTLAEYFNLFKQDINATFRCFIGNLESSNFKNLVTTPFGNYTICMIRYYSKGQASGIYETFELVAMNSFGTDISHAYIFKSANETIQFSGWGK